MKKENVSLALREQYNFEMKNYNWEKFHYRVSRSSYSFFENKSNIPEGRIFGKKDHFLQKIQAQQKVKPGPSSYFKKQFKSFVPNSCINMFDRFTIFDQLERKDKKQKKPGPYSYFQRSKTASNHSLAKVKSKVKIKKAKSFHRINFLDQVQYQANCIPGVGAYNIRVPNNKLLPQKNFISKSKKNVLKIDERKNKLSTIQPLKSIPGTFQWMKYHKKKSLSVNFEKKNNQKQNFRKILPRKYDHNTDWSSKQTILPDVTVKANNKGNLYYK